MRYIITHGHIFKNAGTTFDYALKQAFGRDFCDHRNDVDMRRGGAEYLKSFILENPNLKAISSHHLCNPLPVSDKFKCIPVYFIRNPIDRIISVYNFERKQPKSASLGAKMASQLSLIDYVKWRMTKDSPMVVRNYQTAYIGDEQKMISQSVNLSIFKNALARIESENVLIGTVERFDESFQLISEKLNSFFPEIDFKYKNKNVTNKKSTEEKYLTALQSLQTVMDQIISNNSYDLALYQAANELLVKK